MTQFLSKKHLKYKKKKKELIIRIFFEKRTNTGLVCRFHLCANKWMFFDKNNINKNIDNYYHTVTGAKMSQKTKYEANYKKY